MRRALVVVLALVLLAGSGCQKMDQNLDRALDLRKTILSSNEFSFDVFITADYGEKLHTFSMKCTASPDCNITFVVTQPSTIAGISGMISDSKGKITFDDKVLLFELLADGQITPVSAPWLMVRTLCGGYINGCGKEGDKLHIQFDDSYEDDALRLDLWTGENDLPVFAEILWRGRRIVSMSVENFTFL